MSTSIKNNVQLIGHLGADVDLKTFESGKMMASFSLATNDNYTNSSGEKVEETSWHSLVAWGKRAENVSTILAKGDQVAISGKLTYRSYEKDDQTKYVTEIVVNEFFKLTPKG